MRQFVIVWDSYVLSYSRPFTRVWLSHVFIALAGLIGTAGSLKAVDSKLQVLGSFSIARVLADENRQSQLPWAKEDLSLRLSL